MKASLTEADWKSLSRMARGGVKVVESKDRRPVAVERNLWKNSLIQ